MTQNVPPATFAPQPLSQSDERLWATLIHIGGLVGVVIFGGFLGWVAPLIGYLVLKDRSAFVRENARNALNFQITMAIAAVISAFLWLLVVGFFLTVAIGVVVIVFSIIAAVRANRGEVYRYPLTFQFIK